MNTSILPNFSEKDKQMLKQVSAKQRYFIFTENG